MTPAPCRRDILRAAFASVAGLALASAWPGRRLLAQPAGAIAATRLSDRLTLLSGAGGNVVLVAGTSGAALVNGGRREQADDLLQAVAERSGSAAIQALVNTDWHPDHTGLNERLGASGVEIVAHENTKQYLAAEMYIDWQQRTYKPLAKTGLPTRTFFTGGATTLVGERVEYVALGQAHTDGDIAVFVPEHNVLVTGDVFTVGAYPMADYTSGGWLGGMVTALKTLLDLVRDDTRIVPGSGPVQTRADLKAQHDMLSTLRDRIAKMMRQGMSAGEMREAGITREFDARCGDPSLFLTVAYRGMWLHVRELGGIV